MNLTNTKYKKLTSEQINELLIILKNRFDTNTNRHKGLVWEQVLIKLIADESAEKIWSLFEMERTGGEPDIIGYDTTTGEFIFYDCSPESPKGRRNICYDREGLESRKENKPANNALDMATDMGIKILTEEQYRKLQGFGKFDTKTSSWVQTPPDIRKLGGALFAEYRYGKVFIFHNSAPSYYSVRGFRGSIRV